MDNEPWFKSSSEIEEFVKNYVIPKIDAYWEERLDDVALFLNLEQARLIPLMRQGSADDEFEQWINTLT